MRSVLESKQSQEVCKIGFIARDNTVATYQQRRNAFNYTYVKRRVLNDGVTTRALDLTLFPWKTYNAYLIEPTCVLSHEFVHDPPLEYHGIRGHQS